MKGRSTRGVDPPVESSVRHTRSILPDSIYRQLRESLMTGALRPGQRLTLRDIASQMGTSLMPVREAFRRLTGEGALEPLSNGTTRVPILDVEKLVELTELRKLIEGLAARKAAYMISAEELEAVESANDRMVRAIRERDPIAETRANEEFHFGIYRAARSAELIRIIEQVWLRIGPFLAGLLVTYDRPDKSRKRKSSAHHAELLKALRARDGERAEAALRADLAEGALYFEQFVELNRPGRNARR
jgi:DNA-binding GntR family transcriptional regulator